MTRPARCSTTLPRPANGLIAKGGRGGHGNTYFNRPPIESRAKRSGAQGEKSSPA